LTGHFEMKRPSLILILKIGFLTFSAQPMKTPFQVFAQGATQIVIH